MREHCLDSTFSYPTNMILKTDRLRLSFRPTKEGLYNLAILSDSFWVFWKLIMGRRGGSFINATRWTKWYRRFPEAGGWDLVV